MRLALVTDLHFGPEAWFDGKLRKLTHRAPELAEAFAADMRDRVHPDLVVNLGDDIEDESREADLARYAQCQSILRGCGAELVNVAGNHDRIHLDAADLRVAWEMPAGGPLYRSFDRGGLHFVVLYTHERKDRDVTIDAEQLVWLESDLRETGMTTIVLMHHSAAESDLRGNRWFEGSPHICLVKQRKRLRALFERHGVACVFNGHLHWNHLDVIGGVPYVTIQSLVENIDEDAPGRPAAAHAIVDVQPRRIVVEIAGAEPARYQFQR